MFYNALSLTYANRNKLQFAERLGLFIHGIIRVAEDKFTTKCGVKQFFHWEGATAWRLYEMRSRNSCACCSNFRGLDFLSRARF